jgi:uncharacterized protein (UPF0147 family)
MRLTEFNCVTFKDSLIQRIDEDTTVPKKLENLQGAFDTLDILVESFSRLKYSYKGRELCERIERECQTIVGAKNVRRANKGAAYALSNRAYQLSLEYHEEQCKAYTTG